MTGSPDAVWNGQGIVPIPPGSLLVVGTGLIGTSVALAARAAGISVWLDDVDEGHAATAVTRGAGESWRAAGRPTVDHAIVCIPPSAVGRVVASLIRHGVAATFSDTASTKANVLCDLETLGAPADCYIGAHPMAGRERGGPLAGRADLFAGRTWVLTPIDSTRPEAFAAAAGLATACGAVLEVRSPTHHDRAVALVSHLPQLVASALASRLADAPGDDLALTGQALRDLTRIADSDPTLWTDITVANADAIRAQLAGLSADLAAVADALSRVSSTVGTHGQADPDVDTKTSSPDSGEISRSAADVGEITRLLSRGRLGKSRLPGRHGGLAAQTTVVAVVVPDRPGQLYGVLGVLADAEVNVEDLSIDHASGQPTGVLDVAVAPRDAERAIAALRGAGWSAQRAAQQSGEEPARDG
jgi:prephenate dehydrogenase